MKKVTINGKTYIPGYEREISEAEKQTQESMKAMEARARERAEHLAKMRLERETSARERAKSKPDKETVRAERKAKTTYIEECKQKNICKVTDAQTEFIMNAAPKLVYTAISTAIHNISNESALARLESLRKDLIKKEENSDVNDLLQNARQAIFELYRYGVIIEESDLYGYSFYVYRAINRALHKERKFAEIHLPKILLDEDGEESETEGNTKDEDTKEAYWDKDLDEVERSGAIDTIFEGMKAYVRKKSSIDRTVTISKLYYLENLTEKQIGEKLNISFQLVSAYLKTAKKAIATYVSEVHCTPEMLLANVQGYGTAGANRRVGYKDGTEVHYKYHNGAWIVDETKNTKKKKVS